MRRLWIALALGVAGGCGGNAVSWNQDSAKLSTPGVLLPAATPLVTPTYDGSGQATEPTVVYFPDGWQGHLYWMAMSPYPYSDERFENPSILVSEDGQHWSDPTGLTNPLWLPTTGHLSDASLVYDDKTDQLLLYFLNEIRGPEHYFLLRSTSSDGVHWSVPEVQLSGEKYSVSPTVSKVDNTFYLWVIDSESGCSGQTSAVTRRSSLDGTTWSAAQPVNMNQVGFVIWHFNVVAVPWEGQFMALLAAYPLGSDCGHTKLFFADSNDGVTWTTYSRPVLDVASGWQSREVYRSSLIYDSGNALLRVWYSALSAVTGEWHIGYTEKPFNIE